MSLLSSKCKNTLILILVTLSVTLSGCAHRVWNTKLTPTSSNQPYDFITCPFIQQQFYFLCSDLSSYRVSNAVMASSAVLGSFASIRLHNYEDCTQRYSHPDRMPNIWLVDGGVTDNLGVRGSMMSPVALSILRCCPGDIKY